MNWLTILLQYGPEVLKMIMTLLDKSADDRAIAGKNFEAMFLAATRANNWQGMLVSQVCSCALQLPEDSFAQFRAGLVGVADGLAAASAAMQASACAK